MAFDHDDPDAAQRDQLNAGCFCIDVSREAFWAEVASAVGGGVDLDRLKSGRDHLVSPSPAFITRTDLARMQAVVAAVESAATLPGWRDAALAEAPLLARLDFGTRGALMGYDFHLGDDGPRLIEVNTNAGGAFLNALLARAQVACCPEVERVAGPPMGAGFEAAALAMFLDEWRAQRGDGAPRLVAIVDDAPQDQYLYPEFLLAKALFEAHGIAAEIVDPAALAFDGAALRLGERTVDLVYNRLVDFALDAPRLSPLADAYAAGAVVVTPAPRHHALLADKRNLVRLSDHQALQAMGLAPQHAAALAAVPRTRRVEAADGAALWAARAGLFFKPAAGHAAKRVYRGDKLTRRVWDEILASGDYIAQAFCPPTVRDVMVGDALEARKMDVRLYTYAGRTLLVAARLYAGQTTNFRTPGGGFAPVIVIG